MADPGNLIAAAVVAVTVAVLLGAVVSVYQPADVRGLLRSVGGLAGVVAFWLVVAVAAGTVAAVLTR